MAAISGLIASAVMTIACLYFTKTGEDYSRIWLVTSVAVSFFAIILSRLILKKIFHISSNARVIVLLGANATARAIETTIESSNSDIAIAKSFQSGDAASLDLKLVADYVEEYRKKATAKEPITEVWVTHDVFSEIDHFKLLNAFDNSSVSLVYIPELPDLHIDSDERIQMTSGIPTINSDFSKHHKLSQLLKFVEDQVIAWCALIILAPLMLAIAIAIRIESPGPSIFKQRRYGFGGKAFLIWKYRTMYVSEPNTEFKQAQKNDRRVTSLGKFLRRTSLDELPQLINVVCGSMSIVGPRPHPEQLNEQYRGDIPEYMYRHISKPGITGLAQVKGFRGETVDPELMNQRVKYDLRYVRNWSIFLDMKIILQTFKHLATTDKAH